MIHTLNRSSVDSLPKGELFIGRDFFDHYFCKDEGKFIKQLEAVAQCLGLSAIKIQLDTGWSDSLVSEMRYKDLGQYFTVGCISGPLSNLIGLHEFFDGMMSIRNEPSRFFDIATSLLKNIEKRAKLAHDNSFGAIAIADDIAGNKGPLFSFNQFADVFLPVHREFAEIIRENSLFAFFHSDGDTRKVIHSLIKAGYDCLHPIDTLARLNLYELKKEFGERVCFMGHIDTITWSKERIKKRSAVQRMSSKQEG